MDNAYYDEKQGDLTVYCTICGHEEHIFVPDEEFAYRILDRRAPIQNLLPNVPADVREMFITGWCGCCYDLQLMYFPKKAMDELNECIKGLFFFDGNFLSDGFELGSGDEVMEFLCDMENYDGVYNEEVRNALPHLRNKIQELADRIDDGEFDEDEDDDWGSDDRDPGDVLVFEDEDE